MNRDQDSFLDFNNGTFLWTGVVEDVFDPIQAGRLRVRIFGIHSMDRTEVPTDCLPWASVVVPVTEGGASGIGRAVPNTPEGTWVIGFFRDGNACQDPVVLGTLPGIAPPDWSGNTEGNLIEEPPLRNPGEGGGGDTPALSQFSSLEDLGKTLKTELKEKLVNSTGPLMSDFKEKCVSLLGGEGADAAQKDVSELISRFSDGRLSLDKYFVRPKIFDDVTQVASEIQNLVSGDLLDETMSSVVSNLGITISEKTEEAMAGAASKVFEMLQTTLTVKLNNVIETDKKRPEEETDDCDCDIPGDDTDDDDDTNDEDAPLELRPVQPPPPPPGGGGGDDDDPPDDDDDDDDEPTESGWVAFDFWKVLEYKVEIESLTSVVVKAHYGRDFNNPNLPMASLVVSSANQHSSRTKVMARLKPGGDREGFTVEYAATTDAPAGFKSYITVTLRDEAGTKVFRNTVKK